MECERCHKHQATSVDAVGQTSMALCDRCAEVLKIEENKQHVQMKGWDIEGL